MMGSVHQAAAGSTVSNYAVPAAIVKNETSSSEKNYVALSASEDEILSKVPSPGTVELQVYGRFGDHGLHLQDREVNQTRNQPETNSKQSSVHWLL
jgi:hypothetical protein